MTEEKSGMVIDQRREKKKTGGQKQHKKHVMGESALSFTKPSSLNIQESLKNGFYK